MQGCQRDVSWLGSARSDRVNADAADFNDVPVNHTPIALSSLVGACRGAAAGVRVVASVVLLRAGTARRVRSGAPSRPTPSEEWSARRRGPVSRRRYASTPRDWYSVQALTCPAPSLARRRDPGATDAFRAKESGHCATVSHEPSGRPRTRADEPRSLLGAAATAPYRTSCHGWPPDAARQRESRSVAFTPAAGTGRVAGRRSVSCITASARSGYVTDRFGRVLG